MRETPGRGNCDVSAQQIVEAEMIRALILFFGMCLLGNGQTILSVPFRLEVQGEPFVGRVSVKVRLSNRLVASGSNNGNYVVFEWQPTEGATYDLDIMAGRHRIVVTGVHAYDFQASWTLSFDFPPFQTPCGMEVPEGDRSRVIRVDCVVFDDHKGDPPQRVVTYLRTPR